MKTITESHEYDSLNMRPNEIIDLGYSLSGDALNKFAKEVWSQSSKSSVDTYEEKLAEAEAITLQSEFF